MGLMSIQTFTITDPHDRENPIDVVLTDSLIYHGTHTMFCPKIEQEGFCFDGFKAAYGAEIKNIVAACEMLYFKPDGYPAASGFSAKNCVYFSVYYKSARAYTLNTGGERLDGAIRAANTFLAFANDKDLVARKEAHWATVLSQNGPHAETQRVLSCLRDTSVVSGLAQEVENSLSVLKRAVQGGHPVVYAVSADQEWIRELGANAIGDWNKEPFGGIKLSMVPPDRIVARINYTNGISPESE